MSEKKGQKEIRITTHDRLMRAWENSMELVRDFKTYADEIRDDHEAAKMFAQFAEDEGEHAARFREMLMRHQNIQN